MHPPHSEYKDITILFHLKVLGYGDSSCVSPCVRSVKALLEARAGMFLQPGSEIMSPAPASGPSRASVALTVSEC